MFYVLYFIFYVLCFMFYVLCFMFYVLCFIYCTLYVRYIHVTMRRYRFLFINQPDALIIQIYSVIKFYIFRASSQPIIRSFLLYIRHW